MASDTGKLGQIKNQIQDLKTDLKNSVEKQSHLEKELQRIESRINDLNHQILTNSSLSQKQQLILDRLMSKQVEYQEALAAQQALLAKEIAVAYQVGKADYLKVVFNQESPEMLDRMLMYHWYFSQNREKVMSRYEKYLIRLKQNRERIHDTQLELDQVNKKLEEERGALEAALLRHRQALTKMNQSIDHQSDQLKRLLQDQKALENVIAGAASYPNPYSASENEALLRLKGRLPRPVRGNIKSFFGTPIEYSTLKSKGVFIAAQLGEKVHAVASGRIIFSKWLRGYGLLVIIDHGHQFMSLYGHNSRLYKGEGELVKAGETIAEIGQISGYENSGLYFEIRKSGIALDPNQWFEKRS